MNTIVKIIYGSHLYGTSTPESDKDFKGVFLPSRDEILLGKIPNSMKQGSKKDFTGKNSPGDIDFEEYSLHYFIHLACEGETVALDMLHAPDNMILMKSYTWDFIVSNRQRFYTKNLKAFIGYARRQASKYGIKGSRLNDAKRVRDFLINLNAPFDRLGEHWVELPTGEHIFKHPSKDNGIRLYEVCGRKIGDSASIRYATDVVKKFCDAYGERARQAANNEGIDWKAVSHAFRAAYQVKQILTEGTITFPLKEAKELLMIKQGKLDYQTVVAPELDLLIEEVEMLSSKSTLPEKVDRNFWDDFIINALDHAYHFITVPPGTCI